jgi:serine/threonine-protein kinase RsbW
VNVVAELDVPARAEFIGVVRLVVSTLAAQLRVLDSERVEDLKLAVSEACTNAVEAQNTNGEEPRVLIRCMQDDDSFEVLIDDSGGGFDPSSLPTHPPVTDPARLHHERGLGIPLIRSLVDEVEFAATEKGTRVRLSVRCAPAPPPMSAQPAG